MRRAAGAASASRESPCVALRHKVSPPARQRFRLTVLTADLLDRLRAQQALLLAPKTWLGRRLYGHGIEETLGSPKPGGAVIALRAWSSSRLAYSRRDGNLLSGPGRIRARGPSALSAGL